MNTLFKNQSFLFILVTAFLSVMGIGIIIPVIPFIVAKYDVANNPNVVALHVGLLISIYAFCQFFAAPGLGALSDRYGRRPILLLCLVGSAIGYLMFGIGGSLWILYLSRIVDGLTGGDISTIFAYVADITEPKERGKSFGILGGVIGFGFIVGPTVGGLLSHISLSTPLFAAAAVCLLNAAWGYFVLPESHKEHRTTSISLKHLNPFEQLGFALSKTTLRILLFIGFFYMWPFAQLQGNNSVLYKDTMHWDAAQIGFIFLLVGVIDIITQGFIFGKLVPKFGEAKMAIIGLTLTVCAYLSYAALPLYPHFFVPYLGVLFFAFGSGFLEPALNGLVSHTAKPGEQGRVQGANQSMQSLARIIGPITAALLYQLSWSMPSLVSAILSIVAIVGFVMNRKMIATLTQGHHG